MSDLTEAELRMTLSGQRGFIPGEQHGTMLGSSPPSAQSAADACWTPDTMSDEAPFALPPIPLMSALKARNIARSYEAIAEQLEDAAMPDQAAAMSRRAAWWLAYATALAAIPPGAIDRHGS
jgi:hypothetical protein